ncbi:AlpA family transcriptional regulator, partial [Klebsiella pneumoniae]|nr:AlpA family transcriptional regulator [Klebsiella pneumoniae]MDZ1175131.1 AlpA family transcriptional regulator [Klebsiella pneumoniae]
MSNTRFTPPTPEQRRTILAEYGIKFDRRIRESECFEITSLSRSTRWYMENEGKFPPRCHGDAGNLKIDKYRPGAPFLMAGDSIQHMLFAIFGEF